ncbi:MAG: TauD/TfdA family dioxygenase [Ilumatobacteraceae bacterium]
MTEDSVVHTPREGERVVVVSIDGLASRAIGWSTTPRLCSLALQGASTFSASTVTPPITAAAPASMLRGVPPETHGITTDDSTITAGIAPSFRCVAPDAGRTIAAVARWHRMLTLIETGAVTHQHAFCGGYGIGDDEVTVHDAIGVFECHQPDVSFIHLSGPDLAGHASGWVSDAYLRAATRADRHLGRLLDTLEPGTAVLVTADHGGEQHGPANPTRATMETFIVVRSERVRPRSVIENATILDIAPTVADLGGAIRDPEWSGESVLDRCVPLEDWLLHLVGTLSEHEYGERVDMLSHSLQTAASARADGATDSLVLAALFHDIGHLMGPTTQWGLPDHAEVGARFLARWFGPAVTEPIRLHVAAKRYLTATDPAYISELSDASRATLEQQGGPFTPSEAAAFQDHPMADDAVRLRRADDAGKLPDHAPDLLDTYRCLVGPACDAAEISTAWARDSCQCTECRDPRSDQHLIGVSDLAGWTTTAAEKVKSGWTIDLRHQDGRTHRCTIASPTTQRRTPARTTWGAGHSAHIRPGATTTTEFAERLATLGIALIEDRGTTPGTILDFARDVGFVRNTNYGELFDVIAEASPTNLAFTNVGLPLHTDNPYRDPVPTVQLLHCLHSAEAGGGSMFSDGFRAASQLRESQPRAFELLTATPVRFEFRDDSVLLTTEVPLIELDARGQVNRVTVNNRSMRSVDIGDRTSEFYDAYSAFAALLAHVDNTISLDLAPGEIIGFDNRRVLHGRSGFAASGARHLQGCYIDIDAINSTAALAAADPTRQQPTQSTPN